MNDLVIIISGNRVRACRFLPDRYGHGPESIPTEIDLCWLKPLKKQRGELLLQSIARRIEIILQQEGCLAWNLAGPQALVDPVTKLLRRETRKKLSSVLRSDCHQLSVEQIGSKLNLHCEHV